MKRFGRLLAITLLSVAFGAVLGPVLIAAAGAAFAPAVDQYGTSLEAAKLVDAYRDRLPTGILFTSIVPPGDGAECGYEPDVVFPDGFMALTTARRTNSYANYEGYSVLNRWRIQNRDESWIRSITAELQNQMSPFKTGFLRRCIEATLFADMCMRRVEEFGDTVPRFPRSRETGLPGEGIEDRIVCTFVDGVAARKGIPLARGGATGN